MGGSWVPSSTTGGAGGSLGFEAESHTADADGVTLTGIGGLGRAHGATATETCLVAPMMAISKSGRSKPVTAPSR
jgi:hypothetical protein